MEQKEKLLTLIQWDESYNTGLEKVDKQHQNLVQMINELYTVMIMDKGREDVAKILRELSEYTVYHFQTEEKLFGDTEYPQKEEHKKKHRDLVEEVISFKEGLVRGERNLTDELLNFLKAWLVDHILDMDQDFAEYVKRAEASEQKKAA